MKMRQFICSFLLSSAVAEWVPVDHYRPFPVQNGVIEYTGSVVTSLTKDGNLSWRFDAGVRIDSAGVGPEGMFYIGLQNGTLLALNSNGHIKWDFVASCMQDNYRCYVPDAIHLDSDGSIFLRTAGSNNIKTVGKWPAYLYRLSSAGKVIWHVEVSAPPYYSASGDLGPLGSPWFGQKASKDLIFVRGAGGNSASNLTALSKSDATQRWSCIDCVHSTYDHHSLPHLTSVSADGKSLITTKGEIAWSVRKISAQDGSVLWTFTMPHQSYAEGISEGSDGTVYAYYRGVAEDHSPSGIVSITSQGELKWNLTLVPTGASTVYGYPSEQDDKGNVLLARLNVTPSQMPGGFNSWRGDTVTLHPDGSLSLFSNWSHQFPEGVNCLLPPKPVKQPDGSVHFEICGIVAAFGVNGDKKMSFTSFRGPPSYADDGTIYIEREAGYIYPLDLYLVEVDSETGSDKWTHKLVPKGCTTYEKGYQCFTGFCRVPTKNWSPPPPACTQQGSDFCCYDDKFQFQCAGLCANNSKCVAFDWGPRDPSIRPPGAGQCCLFADAGPHASTRGADDNKTVRGCWAPFSNPEVSFKSTFPQMLV